MTDLAYIVMMTGADSELAAALLMQAEAVILNLCGRTVMIDGLRPAVRSLAVCYYNRMGSEGMASRTDSEIGLASTFTDVPEDIAKQVYRYRLARVGGAYYEAE